MYQKAIDDALGAYRAPLEGGEDPSTIVFARDSAGGGLTVTTCRSARATELPTPAAIVGFFSDSTASGRTGAWTPRPASNRS
ncbi:MAG TPA: alpha/beta hydrolase fold domain-containing protein [Candidatus Dormibacteraeota bacterium]|jgi:acetyl esterase/lipase|nr:alpha/beta hydrolase fold domain-containing protein [Candidatus Dormibacteraeota bacterium]